MGAASPSDGSSSSGCSTTSTDADESYAETSGAISEIEDIGSGNADPAHAAPGAEEAREQPAEPAEPAQKPQATQAAPQQTNTPRLRTIIPTIAGPAGTRLVPRAFQHCEMPDIIALVAHMLDRLLAHNDSLPNDRPLTRFHSRAPAAIAPHAYLSRIVHFTNVDPCIIVILLYYIDRLSEYLVINSLTVHRFLIAAICCGTKALSDSFATNSRYARVGGVELVEMNALEREFLLAINWRLATSGALLDQYWRSIVEAHPGYQLIPPQAAESGISALPPQAQAQAPITTPSAPTNPASASADTAHKEEEKHGRPSKRAKGESAQISSDTGSHQVVPSPVH